MVAFSLDRFLAGCRVRFAGTDQHKNFPVDAFDVVAAAVPGLNGLGGGREGDRHAPRPSLADDVSTRRLDLERGAMQRAAHRPANPIVPNTGPDSIDTDVDMVKSGDGFL